MALDSCDFNTLFTAMFTTAIKLFKARKDKALASQIAGEFAVDGAVEYVSWPIRIAKFWMTLALLALIFFTALFLWLAYISHWSVGAPALISGGLIYLIIRVWRGINIGTERVSHMAKAKMNARLDRLNKPDASLD